MKRPGYTCIQCWGPVTQNSHSLGGVDTGAGHEAMFTTQGAISMLMPWIQGPTMTTPLDPRLTLPADFTISP